MGVQEGLDLAQLFRAEHDVPRSEVFQSACLAPAFTHDQQRRQRLDCGHVRGARKRHDVLAERADPRDAQLGNADAFLLSDGLEPVHDRRVFQNRLDLRVSACSEMNYARGAPRPGSAPEIYGSFHPPLPRK